MRLEYAGNPNAGDIGPMMTFAQHWYASSSDVIRTGGIAGIKTIGSGAYGGGLAFYAQPNSSADMNQAMVINHAGFVGIGTNSPSGITNGKFLEIKNTSTGTGTHAQITLTGSNGHTNLLLASGDDTTGGDPVLSSTTNHAIRFGHSTNSTFAGFSEHMRIDSAGNIGIGTSTPSTLLDVNGTATATTFVGALTGNVTGTILTAAQANITSVGTLSNLTTSGFAKADNYQFYQNSVASGVSDAIYRKTTATMAFKTGSTERMLIDSNGNLGVGTGSTTVASRIMLTESAYARLTLNQSTTGRNWQIGNDGNNFYIYLSLIHI